MAKTQQQQEVTAADATTHDGAIKVATDTITLASSKKNTPKDEDLLFIIDRIGNNVPEPFEIGKQLPEAEKTGNATGV
jgi:hypothetical protein